MFDWKDLDERTRTFMLAELELDLQRKTFYENPRILDVARESYLAALKDALRSGSETTLAAEIQASGFLKAMEHGKSSRGRIYEKAVPWNAHETLAEHDFNRYYMRGLCRRALEDGVPALEVYRAKEVARPRPESVARIGFWIDPRRLLRDLRESRGIETVLGIPPGPNSGLSVRIPSFVWSRPGVA